MTDRDEGDETAGGLLIPVAPERVLEGECVADGGTVTCSRCSRKIYSGETVLVHAHRIEQGREWVIVALCCPLCQEDLIKVELPKFVEGTELLARSTLMVCSGNQLDSYLALTHVSALEPCRRGRRERGRE